MKMEKIRIKEVIVVEGKYDAALVRSAVDAAVIELGGYRIFNDRKKMKMLAALAESRGVIILTDSDGAGLVIRNRLRAALPSAQVKNAYVPQVAGRERRKEKASKAGLLGVEGMDAQTVVAALISAGATVEGSETPPKQNITRADFYRFGLLGGANSSIMRKKLTGKLGIPDYLSVSAIIEYLNASGTDIEPLISEIKDGEKRE